MLPGKNNSHIIPTCFPLVRSIIRSEMMFMDELQHIQAPVARSTPNSRRARSFLVRSGLQLNLIWIPYWFSVILHWCTLYFVYQIDQPGADPAKCRARRTKNDLSRRLFGVERATGACICCNSSINIISERIISRTRWNCGGTWVEHYFSR